MTVTGAARPTTARGMRTRAQLLEAGRAQFEQDGFAAARVTDIADRAGLSHGTFYTYFDSKEAILQELIERVRDEMLAGSAEVVVPEREQGDAPWQSIARANRRYLATYRKNARLMVVWEQAATINPIFRDMMNASRQRFSDRSEVVIRKYQDDGTVDERLNPAVVAVALGAMVSRFAYIWHVSEQPFEFDDAVGQLTMLWCNSLGIPHRIGEDAD